MHRRQRDVRLANVALRELSRQTGGLPEIASGDAVADLERGLSDHVDLLRDTQPDRALRTLGVLALRIEGVPRTIPP